MSPASHTPTDPVATAAAVATVELAARLQLSTTRLARRLRQEAEIDLTPTVVSAMAVIDRHGPLTLGALAELESVAPPTVTKVVNKLEDRGLVTRLVDPADRRVCRVECTTAGRDLLEASRERKNAWLAARLDEIDETDRARLTAALEVLERLASGV